MKTISLTKEEQTQLEVLAQEQEMDLESVVHEAIQEYLEERTDLKEAEKNYTKWVAGGRKSKPISEIISKLNLENN